MLKEKLKEVKDQNINLYEHLNNVLIKIILDNPKNAFELFEDYSFQVKSNGFKFEKYNEFDNLERSKLLTVSKQTSKLRFWGKIRGKQKDYYIAEGIAANTIEDGELPPEVEPRGSGVNTKSYWTCNDIFNDKEWIGLPLITPQQINVSRQIKYLFTGNLEADVITNPYFFEKEKHLLKAQIVRIAQSTEKVNQGEIDPAPEYKLPGFHDLKTLNDWIHFNQNILNCGRLVHLISSELPEGVEPEAYQKQIEAADPFENRLKPISNDKLPNNKPAWKIRIVGGTTDYNPLAKDTNNKVNNGFGRISNTILCNNINKQYSNKVLSQLYYGNGFKQITNHFYSKQPQQVQSEQPDLHQQPEHNFPPEIPQQQQD